MQRRTFIRSLAAGTAAVGLVPWAEARAMALGRRRADFTFTRLEYGSGDWDVDQRMPANLLNSLIEYTTITVDTTERVVPLASSRVFDSPFAYMAGHRLVQFSPKERDIFERYVRQVGDLTGVVSCCVFEIDTGRAIAHAGATPAAGDLGLRGKELLAAMSAGGRQLGFGQAVPEAAITLASHHLLLRPVPRNAGLVLHAVLDKATANLTLARLQVLRMDSLFEEADKAEKA